MKRRAKDKIARKKAGPKAKKKTLAKPPGPKRAARSTHPVPPPPSPPVATQSIPEEWKLCQRHGCSRPAEEHGEDGPHAIPDVCEGFVYAEGVTEQAFIGGGGRFGGGGATGGWD